MKINVLLRTFEQERLTQTPIKKVSVAQMPAVEERKKCWYQMKYICTHNQKTKFLDQVLNGLDRNIMIISPRGNRPPESM